MGFFMAIDFSNLTLSTPTQTSTDDETTLSKGIDFSKLTLGQPKRTVGGTLKDIAESDSANHNNWITGMMRSRPYRVQAENNVHLNQRTNYQMGQK